MWGIDISNQVDDRIALQCVYVCACVCVCVCVRERERELTGIMRQRSPAPSASLCIHTQQQQISLYLPFSQLLRTPGVLESICAALLPVVSPDVQATVEHTLAQTQPSSSQTAATNSPANKGSQPLKSVSTSPADSKHQSKDQDGFEFKSFRSSLDQSASTPTPTTTSQSSTATTTQQNMDQEPLVDPTVHFGICVVSGIGLNSQLMKLTGREGMVGSVECPDRGMLLVTQ